MSALKDQHHSQEKDMGQPGCLLRLLQDGSSKTKPCDATEGRSMAGAAVLVPISPHWEQDLPAQTAVTPAWDQPHCGKPCLLEHATSALLGLETSVACQEYDGSL